MATTKTDALQRAIDSLGAVEVARNYYAFPDEGAWSVGSFPELDDQGAVLWRKPHAMPPWWSPEQRFTWRATDACEVCAGFANQRPTTDPRDAADVPESHWERITADLETGQEVPA